MCDKVGLSSKSVSGWGVDRRIVPFLQIVDEKGHF